MAASAFRAGRAVALVACMAFGQVALAGGRIFVRADAELGGDGKSWETAFPHLQDALAAAGAGGAEIWVARGVYRPDEDVAHPEGTGDRKATFQLISGVAVLGGFSGDEDPATFDPAARYLEANRTILSGDLAGNDGQDFTNRDENSNHVVTGSGTGPTAILDGVTVSGGYATHGASWVVEPCGGGMYNVAGSPTLRRCTFRGNSTQHSGGAIYNVNGSSPTLTDCSFANNLSSQVGGAIYNDNACNPTLVNCALLDNTADSSGGAIYNAAGKPTLTNCRFSGNSSDRGGAIYGYLSSPTLINCTFSGNSALEGGAFYIGNQSGPVLIQCTIAGNWGGAGGCMYNNGAETTPSLVNCIVWGNGSSAITGSANLTYTCIEGGWAGSGNLDLDPKLIFVAGGNVRLRRGSPCIDAGSNEAVPAGISSDLAGNPRFGDDPDTADTGRPGSPPRPIVDMGAYEYQPVPAERLYVKADASPGGNGQDWTSAFRFLQDAFAVAEVRPGVTEIWVSGGSYAPDRREANPAGTRDRNATFSLPGGVAIYGGFPGLSGQEGNFSVRDAGTYVSTLTGDLARDDGPGRTNNAENSYHVATGSWVGAATILDGFILQGGHASTAPSLPGGAMYCVSGSPTLTGCTFRENESDSAGGGLYCFASRAVLTNCTFAGNTAANKGGGFLSSSSQPVLTGCTFVGNTNKSNQRLHGAGMYSSDSSPTLTNCTFKQNTITSNGNGGGTCSRGGSPVLIGCTFEGNTVALGEGGGLYNESCGVTLINCTFNGNAAHLSGGGMLNTASHGSIRPVVINCTFAGNNGGGLSNSSGIMALTNCIVWGNAGGSVVNSDYEGLTVTYSCIQGGWPGQGNIDADPRLLSSTGGKLGLRRGSPCIDAGDNRALPAGTLTDLAGGPRFVDEPETPDTGNPEAGGPVVDMGAYEYRPVASERVYVNAGNAAGGDGRNWATATRHLQDGLRFAEERPGVTEIWVAADEYRPDRDADHPAGTRDRTATFQLLGGVAIYGGFPGSPGQEADTAVRNPGAFLTVLSGDLAGDDGPEDAKTGENAYHVLNGSNSGPAAVLDGFTVTGGKADGLSFPGTSNGGGIYIKSGSPTLANCVFRRNWSAALYTRGDSRPAVFNCAFFGNRGAAIYSEYGGSVKLTNCTISGNFWGVAGEPSRAAVVTNCIVWGNQTLQIRGADVSYSCIWGGYAGTGNISTDPRLMYLPGGNLRLRRGSPCIDAGDNTAVPSWSRIDADGNSRLIDDADTPDTGHVGNPPRPLVDMGAYEYQPVAAERLYVKADATAGGDGRSWTTPCRHLQDALRIAQVRPGVGEIWVAEGVYKPDRDDAHVDGTRDRSASFMLMDWIALYGGFPGLPGQEGAWGLRNPAKTKSILSGDLAGDDGPDSAGKDENSYHVVTGDAIGPSAVLDGFTLSGGNANGDSWPKDRGGGMYNRAAGPTVMNCVFRSNVATSSGGGMANLDESGPTLTGCTFEANSAPYGGGVSFVNGSSTEAHLTNCRISGNFASDIGGGIYNESSRLTLINCTVNANTYSGVYSMASPLTLINCTVAANISAGIISHDQLALVNCILWGNTERAQLFPPDSPYFTVTYSCVQGGWTGMGNISADPRFANLAGGDLRLSPGSPCIDAGSNAAAPAGLTTDAAGRPRFIDDPAVEDCLNAPGGCGTAPVVDMGAFEYSGVATDLDQDGDVDGDDLRAFAACVSGPAVPAGEACVRDDLDRDGDTDQEDFGVFQRCYGGANQPPPAGC